MRETRRARWELEARLHEYAITAGGEDQAVAWDRETALRIVRAVNTHDDLVGALNAVLADPGGCPTCDSGRLRPGAMAHWPECGFLRAGTILARSEDSSVAAPRPDSGPMLTAAPAGPVIQISSSEVP